MIWLVDYTHYSVNIDSRLSELRRDYFTIKRYVRERKIGTTAPVSTRTFSNGLLRIATLLAHNSIPVRYLHYDMVQNLLQEGERPEIVAFSAVCPSVPRCASLAEQIKDISPSTKVAIGGIHINQACEETKRRFPIFDLFSTGRELEAAEFLAGRPLKLIKIPYVDYQLLPYPLKDYSINTFSAVGCPFHCDYCADGITPYYQTMQDGQIGIMKNLLPKKTVVHFFDSVLGYNKAGALALCKKLHDLQHDFVLSCDMRADMLDVEVLKALERAGFVEVRMGFESASGEVLSANGRRLKPERFLSSLKMIRDCSNLYVALYSITGMPKSTVRSHMMTMEWLDYLLRNRLIDEFKNGMYVPYPMQNVDYSRRGVYIVDDDWSHYDRSSFPVYYLDNINRETIWRLFIQTAEQMNQSWLSYCGFENISQIPKTANSYHEYYEVNYHSK